MLIEILFEDQDLLIINKPPGIVVNRAETNDDEAIQDWLAARMEKLSSDWQTLIPETFDSEFGTPEDIWQLRQGLVHRLDKDTSGVLVLAKNPGSLVNVLSQFKNRQVQKKYICLTHGKFRVPTGTIHAPMERARFDRQRFAVGAGGRPAETRYEVTRHFSGFKEGVVEKLFDKEARKRLNLYQGFSQVDCWPKTGRTHQIRVHLQHWGHPVVGDHKYVGKKRVKLDEVWVPRQFLHAAEIELTHPHTGQPLIVQAPLTSDLKLALDLLVSEE